MKSKFLILSIFLASLAMSSCLNSNRNDASQNPTGFTASKNDTSPEFNVLYESHTGWTYNMNIYEVNLRQYTAEGTFKAFEGHLPRLKEMGVGLLWLMPIHPIGEKNRLGSLGSYYSVKDYKDVNVEFGSMDDFKSLIKNTHMAGMHVIIDWVANHTSWDNPLTLSNPEFYLLTNDGNFQGPPGMNWSDVIQLDYSNMKLQNYMIQTLKEWVINTGIDGFRFDYVDGVPPSFWIRAIAELKALKPDIFLLAEGEGVKYHTMGFDMDYNWGFYGWGKGLSRQIFKGTKTVAHLDSFMHTTKNNYMPDKYQMFFTSNHDENSWEGTEFEQLGASAEVFAVLTQTFYGMPLVYSGQEAGLNKRLDFFDKNQIDWNDLVYNNLYTILNNLRDTNCALWNGSKGAIPVRINTGLNSQVFAYSRSKDKSEVLVFLNLSATAVSFGIKDKIYSSSYQNIFTNKQVNLATEKTISLDPWDYLVLVK